MCVILTCTTLPPVCIFMAHDRNVTKLPAAYLKNKTERKKKTHRGQTKGAFSDHCIFHIKTATVSMLFARWHFLCKHFSSDHVTFVTLTMEIFNNKKTCQICDEAEICLHVPPHAAEARCPLITPQRVHGTHTSYCMIIKQRERERG